MLFKDLDLHPSILSALEKEGYQAPTPVQAASIPTILQGRDLLGCAQTGTGKTAAFALPTLQLLNARPSQGRRDIRALVLTPTRELAIQIQENFAAYGANLPLRTAVIFGGVGEGPQKAQLRAGVDVLIATPGRLMDLMQQGFVHLDRVEIFILDEADRMLDMGFIHDVRRVSQKLPQKRQTLLFSATMPPEIRKLADTLLRNPATVEVARVSSTAEKIDQGVFFVPKDGKAALLRRILSDRAMSRVLVFTRTKHGADRVRRSLEQNRIPAEAIHGNKSQNARQRSLSGFKDGSVRVLVATDLAARGIDVDDVSHVINYDLPQDPESYVHRIGRTARAGASGVAMSLVTPEERSDLRVIERLIKKEIRVLEAPEGHELPAGFEHEPAPAREPERRAQGGESRGGRDGGRNGRQGQGRGDGRQGRPQGRGQGQPAGGQGGNRDSQGGRQAQPQGQGRNPGGEGQEGGQRRGGRGGRGRGERSFVREYFSNRD